MNYLEKFKVAVSRMDERQFDKYVLGPFLIWYGMKSKGMNKKARRILVGAGIFQIFYQWGKYTELHKTMMAWLRKQKQTPEQFRKI